MTCNATRFAVFVLAMVLAACSSAGGQASGSNDGEATELVVTGSVGYRERVALLPGSAATVTLIDHSRADAPSTALAEVTIDLQGRQVPVPFELRVPRAQLDPRHRYAVRAVIRGPEGQLGWTTDAVHAVDPTAPSQDLGLLTLVRAGQAPPSGMPGHPLQPGKAWRVEDINRGGVVDNSRVTLTFGADGSLSGSTGCNGYTAKYRLAHAKAGIVGPIAVTRKLCPPALMDQEARFLAILGGEMAYSVTSDGALILANDDGTSLRAR